MLSFMFQFIQFLFPYFYAHKILKNTFWNAFLFWGVKTFLNIISFFFSSNFYIFSFPFLYYFLIHINNEFIYYWSWIKLYFDIISQIFKYNTCKLHDLHHGILILYMNLIEIIILYISPIILIYIFIINNILYGYMNLLNWLYLLSQYLKVEFIIINTQKACLDHMFNLLTFLFNFMLFVYLFVFSVSEF